MSDSNNGTIRETIDDSPLFKHLGEDWRRRLAEASELEEYSEGEKIINEDETGQHHLFIVIDGSVRVWTDSPTGEVDLKSLGPGAYFGEVSLMHDKTATATVEAEEDVEVVAVDRHLVLELVEQNEKVRDMLEGVTLARAKETIDKVLDTE
ncbi:MAG: cyclic nucleotide-binding domain-containing protein [Bradymonadaceae bacterium]